MKNYFFLLLLTITITASSQPGTLDSSFGTNGQVYDEFGDDLAMCEASALQTDGKIVCVGTGNMLSPNPPIWGFLVLRYLDNGTLDESFGQGGRIVTSFSNGGGYAKNVVIQPDGKIVVVGHGGFDTSSTGTDIFVVRYNPDGSMDESFGNNGLVTTDFGLAQTEEAYAVAIQRDGKLVVTGNYASQYFFTVRYNADGSLDESFGDGGKVIPAWGGLSFAYAIALQPDGKILTAGMYSSHYAVIARYLPDGRADSSFGENGVVYNYNGYIYNAICLQANGKILAGGQTENGVAGDMLLVRYNSDGEPDSSFGINSSVKFIFSQPASFIKSLALYGENKIMIAGTVGNAFNPKWNEVVVSLLYLNDGDVDTGFGKEGFATFLLNGISTSTGLITKDGDIVVQALSATYDGVYLFRFNGFPQQPTPIARIKRWLHKHGFTWEDCPPSICDNITGYAVQRSSNGVGWTTVYRSPLTANSRQSTVNGQQLAVNRYIDPAPLPGTSYYRLQTTSVNGAVAYSNVVAISYQPLAISLSPNPAKNILRIEGLPSNQKTKIMVVDLGGNVALSLERSAFSSEVAGMRYGVSANGQQPTANSLSSYHLNIASLKPGNYMLRIESNGAVVTKQFLKE